MAGDDWAASENPIKLDPTRETAPRGNSRLTTENLSGQTLEEETRKFPSLPFAVRTRNTHAQQKAPTWWGRYRVRVPAGLAGTELA